MKAFLQQGQLYSTTGLFLPDSAYVILFISFEIGNNKNVCVTSQDTLNICYTFSLMSLLALSPYLSFSFSL